MSDQNTSLKQETERKKVQNSLKKISFFAILKIVAILKTCEKNFLIKKTFILIENVAKNIKIRFLRYCRLC
jgi:hypothetical protein